MHIVVDHQINDPEKFWSAVQQASIPEGITLHSVLPNQAGNRAMCHWEADSVDTVRTLVDGAVGQYSHNEFFEVDPAKAIGL